MIKKFLNLFRSKVTRLTGVSTNIFNTFTKTIKDLEDVNTKILDHDQELEVKEIKLADKRAALKQMHEYNTHMKEKFQNFLEN